MRKPVTIAVWSLVALAVVTAALLYAGDAIHWNRELPYELTASWGGSGDEPGRFDEPTGIAVTADEVLVADARNGRVQVFDKHGDFRRAFGRDVLGRPMNLAVADGRVYVPDYFGDVVHVFSASGDHQRAIAAEDGLDSPGGVAVEPGGTLLVADTYNQRVVSLGRDGTVRRVWGTPGEADAGAGSFSYPTDVALAPTGGFFVADGYNDRVQQFGADGGYVRRWGGPFGMNVPGPLKGWFAVVTAIAVGPKGHLFAADFYNDRVQKFALPGGGFRTAFGTPAPGPGHSQIGVAVDGEGTVWTTDFAGDRVQRWRPAAR